MPRIYIGSGSGPYQGRKVVKTGKFQYPVYNNGYGDVVKINGVEHALTWDKMSGIPGVEVPLEIVARDVHYELSEKGSNKNFKEVLDSMTEMEKVDREIRETGKKSKK